MNRIIVLIAFLVSSAGAAPVTTNSFEEKVYKSPNGGELLYRQMNPQKQESGRKCPVVLFLHGAGGRGSDNARQLSDINFSPELLNKVNFLEKYPCFMIAPQVPATNRWVEVHWGENAHAMPDQPGAQLRMAIELVKKFAADNPVDTNRIYITGVSMGGFGTWDAVQRYPDLFAAAAPVCGGGDTAQAAKLVKLPLWAWHGDKDTAVKTQRSRDMIEAVKKAGGQPRYTELPNTGHDAWNAAYGQPDLWDWMFKQARDKKSVPAD